MAIVTTPDHIRNLARNLQELLQEVAQEYEYLEAETTKLQAENVQLRGVLALSTDGSWPHERRRSGASSQYQDPTPSDSGDCVDFKDASSEIDTSSFASSDGEQRPTCPAEREVPPAPIGPGDVDVGGLRAEGSVGPEASSATLAAALQAHGRPPSRSSSQPAVSFGAPGAARSPAPEGLSRSAAHEVDAGARSRQEADPQTDGRSPPSNGHGPSARRRSRPECIGVGGDARGGGSSTSDGGACRSGAPGAAAADEPPEELSRSFFWTDGEGGADDGEARRRANGRPSESEVPAPSLDKLNASHAVELAASAAHGKAVDEQASPARHGAGGDDAYEPSEPPRPRSSIRSVWSSHSWAEISSVKDVLGKHSAHSGHSGHSGERNRVLHNVLPSSGSPRRKTLEALGYPQFGGSRRRQLQGSIAGRAGTGFRAVLGRMVASPYFDMFSGTLITTNMVYMGIQVHFLLDREIRRLEGTLSGEEPQEWFWFDLAFGILFFAELTIRAMGLGRQFVFGPDRRWHLLEVLLVGVSISELIRVDKAFDVSLLRGMRLVRIVRIVQIAADSSLIGSLRNMMHSLGKSMVCFSPVVLLLGVVLYVFSVVFMQAVYTYLIDVSQASVQDESTKKIVNAMARYFGSLGRTLLTLFMCISGGDAWIFVARPLEEIGPLTQIIFVVYIAFVLFALLNILNGLFVDAAVHSATAKRKLAVDMAIEDMSEMAAEITSMFAEADEDMDGSISKSELVKYTKNARTKACFESLDLDVENLVRLFDELDAESCGTVELQTFIERCIQMRGVAKKADFALMERQMFKRLENIEQAISKVN